MFSRQLLRCVDAGFFPALSTVGLAILVVFLGTGTLFEHELVVRTGLLCALLMGTFMNGCIVGWRTREIRGPSRRPF